MATTSISALVWPTALDVYGSYGVGAGKVISEPALADRWGWAVRGPNAYVLTGGAVTAASGLAVNVAALTAWISGHDVRTTAAVTIPLPANATSYLYLRLLRDANGLVTAAAIEDTTSSTAVPADSVELAVVTTTGSAVATISDTRVWPRRQLVWTTSGSWRVPGGLVRVRVAAWGAGGGGGGGGGGQGGSNNAAGLPGGHGARGGPGDYAEQILDVTPGTTYTITIGAGGPGGAGGTGGAWGGPLPGSPGASGATGTAGGTTSLGALLSVLGGGGGQGGEGGPIHRTGTYTAAYTPPSVSYLYVPGAGCAGGAGGLGGAGGTQGSGAGGAPGTAGAAGQSGRLLIEYL